MVSPENTHTSNNIWAQQATFRNMHIYANIYVHSITLMKTEAINLKDGGEEYMGWFGGRNRKGAIF